MKAEPKDAKRVADLAVRYLDRTISEDEAKELDRLVCENEDNCELFEQILAQASGLAQASLGLENRGTPSQTEETQAQQPGLSRVSPRTWIPVALAAAVTILAALILSVDRSEAPIATITFEGGEGRIAEEDAADLVRVVPPGQSQPMSSGMWFRIGRADSSAELVFEDGTRVLFYQRAEGVLRLRDGQKVLELREGQIAANVTPQKKGRPFEIRTPASLLEVLGTELEVAASAKATDLVVTHGRVAMIRDTDGSRVEVGAGQRATVDSADASPLEASAIPKLSAEWGEDFSESPGETWGGGKWQADGTMLAYPRFDLGYSHFSVTSNNAWGDGLHSHFQVYPDSYLEVRFMMEKPQWFLIRLGLRATPDSVRKFGGNAFYQNNDWHRDLEPGEWRTVRIPLAKVHHFSRSKDSDVDLNGLGAYLISLSTQKHDAGLVIDYVRVGRVSVK